MSTNLSVVSNGAVSSVGNAWIVCRSKSYAGRIYYFNTSTGETVWNLSEPEIQKAKAMTKILKSQSGFQPEDCPEPVHSPEGDARSGPSKKTEFKYHKMTPTKIYNKQVINNQFTKPYSTELSNYVPNSIHLNIPVAPTFNGLWNIASQPILVAPTPVHQLQHFPNLNQVPVTTTAVSLSNRFKNVSNKRSPSKAKFGGKRNFKPKFNNNGSRKKHFNQKLQNKKNVDLRFVISSKRPNFNNNDIQPSNHPGSTIFGDTRSAHSSHKNTLKESNYNMLNDDDMWLEENLQSQGKTDKLDATPLKNYLQIENSHLWYIIADSNALLKNVNFLNILLNSDKHCRLIVPQIVRYIIQEATSSRFRTQAHRADYFISQQVDANLATIVPHSEDNEGTVDEKHGIITCCSKLMKQDFHVIILTDSIEFNVLKETGEIPILTISEIKKLLSTSVSNKIDNIESPNLTDSRNIKITIPNNKIKTNLNSPLEVKCDQVEVTAECNIIVPETITKNSVASPSPETELKTCVKRLDPCPEIVKKTENERMNRKWYSRKPKILCLDSSSKSNQTFNSKNSNYGSSYESVDNIERNEEISEDCNKAVSVEDISEISNTNTETRPKNASKGKTKDTMECDNVMFEVTGQAMENYLRMKSDEWVSRFIQIMEEVLAQILQQEPKFILETLPPPWTVYEATECIRRKFKFDSDIVDAATKLLNVLFELGGLRGKIKNDLSPEEYMETYSFGVYLIDALQGLLSNSEDLQIAAESLSKLLNDIQNPHLDPCNQDSFADLHPDKEIRPMNDKIAKVITNESDKLDESSNNTENLQNKPSTPKRDESITPDSPKLYNLRSNRQKNIQDKEDVIFIRHLDIESSFFSCLELRKKSQKGIFSKILSNDKQIEDQDSLGSIDETSPEINNVDEVGSAKEPTFIRNITKCIEFEDKLKDKSGVSYDSWTHRNEDYEDYEMLDYESMDQDYNMAGECNYSEEEDHSDESTNDVLKYSDVLDPGDDFSNRNINFKFIIQRMKHNIKGAYSAVHEFCKNSYDRLSSTDTYPDRSYILLAEKTFFFIDNLCNTFNGILDRETSESENKLQVLFKNKVFEGVVITDKDFEDYRSFITGCLVQGNVLKESVRLIMEASKEAAEV